MNPAGGMVAATVMPDKGDRGHRALKAFGITVGVIVAILALVYFVGVVVFMGRFFPNTTIAGIDISLKTPEEVHETLDTAVGDYQFEVVGQGLDMTLTAQEVGMTLDSEAIASGMMVDVNAWAWPVEIFNEHDETSALAATYSSTELADVVGAEVSAFNEGATQPTDATIAYDDVVGVFAVVPEQVGTAIDADAVVEAIAEGVMRFESKIRLTEDVLLQPTVLSDDERIIAAADEANAMIQADLELYMEGNLVNEVTPTLIASWIVVSPEVTVAFNEEALSSWIDGVAASCNTVGTERTYMRADGKTITVSGGTYGWKIDSDSLRTLITDAVYAGTVGRIDIPVLQGGNGYVMGSRDWGERYCDIDLSEQYARFYDSAGACVWETAIVSGLPNGERDTPTGVYYITNKQSPSTLIGQKDSETGEPEYETDVTYWMPFIGNSIGLHDATWQPAFGGTLYKTVGSHGCVNISLSAAASLWDIIKIGDVVVVHW